MRRSILRSLLLASGVSALALGTGACGTSGQRATTTTKPLPPLPPTVLAYVALAGAGNNLGFGDRVAVVNVTAGSVGLEERVPVGTYPDAIAISPDGRTAYVANYSSNDVTPINLVTGRAERALPAGIGPSAIAIAPNGLTAYVTDAGDSTLGDTVTPIDLRTGRDEAPITVGPGPQGIVITPNGTKAYVSDAGAVVTGQSGPIDDQVTPIDLETGKATSPITVGNAPLGLAMTPDGSTVFVANLNSESVTPINVASDTAGAAIAVPGGPIAIVATAIDAWVVDTPASGNAGNNVVPINTSTLTAGKPIPVGRGAQAIALSPNGTTAWVACTGNTIESVDLASHRVTSRLGVAGGPFAIAVANQPQGAVTPSKSTNHKAAKKKS